MPMNVEVKVRIDDPSAWASRLECVAGERVVGLAQEDTFYAVSRERLKMRCDLDGQCELIYYRRPDREGARVSAYSRQPVRDVATRRAELEACFGVCETVRKMRSVFIVEGARVHLDHVEGLGNFVEIAVPVTDDCSIHRAHALAARLSDRIGLGECTAVAQAYGDLRSENE